MISVEMRNTNPKLNATNLPVIKMIKHKNRKSPDYTRKLPQSYVCMCECVCVPVKLRMRHSVLVMKLRARSRTPHPSVSTTMGRGGRRGISALHARSEPRAFEVSIGAGTQEESIAFLRFNRSNIGERTCVHARVICAYANDCWYMCGYFYSELLYNFIARHLFGSVGTRCEH